MRNDNVLFWDGETWPIRPGRQAPRIVCLQLSTHDRPLLREEGLDVIEQHLARGGSLVAHNSSFDVLCAIANRPRLLRPFFEAYSDDRVGCTMVREMLGRIAQGRLKSCPTGLLASVERHGLDHDFEPGDKTSDVRVTYARYDGVPVERWDPRFVRYAMADLVVERLHEAQTKAFGEMPDEFRQARADFVLALMSAHGLNIDQTAVEAFARKVNAEHEQVKRELMQAGLLRPTGAKRTKLAKERMREVCRSKGLPVPITATGRAKAETLSTFDLEAKYTSLTADDCRAVSDPLLLKYARYTSIGNLRSRYQRLQLAGDLPIQPRFNVLVESGRTSCRMGNVKPGRVPTSYGDQVQNTHREPGVRECYRARPGKVLCSVDWSSAELHTLAQVCVTMGFESGLARVLNEGLDAHLAFACQMNGWDYGWALENKRTPGVKAARQGAKAANFGFPGGLGAAKFRLYAAKTYGVELSEDESKALKRAWFQMYPEMKPYFNHVSDLVEHPRPVLTQISSLRRRGGVTYCGAANSYFQGLAADMAKHAGFALAWECYLGVVAGTDTPSPLAGCRLVNFIHDEFILEVPVETAHECATRIVTVMEEAGRVWCPDVPVKAEPALSYAWRKGAEPVTLDGRLVPFEDRPLTPDTRAVIQKELALGRDPIHVGWDFGYETERILKC